MKTTRALETASGGQWRCTARLDEPLREPSQCTTPPRARARPGILHCLRFDVWHVLAITPVMCRHVARWVVINKNDPHGAMGKEVGHLDEVPKLSTNFYFLRTSHNMPCFAQVMLEQVSSKIINQRRNTRRVGSSRECSATCASSRRRNGSTSPRALARPRLPKQMLS